MSFKCSYGCSLDFPHDHLPQDFFLSAWAAESERVIGDYLEAEPLNRGTKTPNPRQGKRKRDKWGFCRMCQFKQDGKGTGTVIKCHKCEHWVCKECCTLRRKKGEVGVYFVHCSPRCILRITKGKRA